MTIDVRAVIFGVILILTGGAIASPFAISIADDGGSPGTAALAAGHAFTYQGRLDVDGVPAEGSYDLEFRLFDALTDGNQMPDGVTVVAITSLVTNGQFTVDLDFGAAAFAGEARWLEVRARASAAGTFAVLSPRQPLTATPYALFALAGGTQYTAGAGLTLAGAQFSLQFLVAGPVAGSANVPARADHIHFGQNWTGATDSAGFYIDNSGIGPAIRGQGEVAIGSLGYGTIGVIGGTGGGTCSTISQDSIKAGVFGNTCPTGGGIGDGVRGYSLQGAGVRGEGAENGVVGDATSSGGNGIGVYGVAGAAPPSVPDRTGVHGYSNGGVGVYGRSLGTNSVAVKGLADGTNSLAGQFIGPITASGCAGCSAPSDQRLKHDIAPATRGLAEILALKPVSFAYNEEIYGAGMHLGFLAQDVREVMPELVAEMETGFLRVDYDGVVPVLAKAIQEQQAQIAAIQPGISLAEEGLRISALEAKVAGLEDRGASPWLSFVAVAAAVFVGGFGLGRLRSGWAD